MSERGVDSGQTGAVHRSTSWCQILLGVHMSMVRGLLRPRDNSPRSAMSQKVSRSETIVFPKDSHRQAFSRATASAVPVSPPLPIRAFFGGNDDRGNP